MELRQLEYLVAVVEEGAFTRAAERLHVAQPGVSAQIRRLEAELGEVLLDRGAGGGPACAVGDAPAAEHAERGGRGRVRPTAAGLTLLPYARAALAAVADGRQAVDELRGLVRGQVAVGVVTACPAIELAEPLAAFHDAHPGVEVTLAEDGSDRLVAGLRDGRVDLAVIGSFGPPVAGLATVPLADEPLVAAVAAGDPLAAREVVPLRALRDRPLVLLPRGTGIRAAFEAGCERTGFEPRVAFEASSPTLLSSLARRGLGVAVVARSMAEADPALEVVALTRPALRSRLELAWRAAGPASPAARALVEHLRAALAPDPA